MFVVVCIPTAEFNIAWIQLFRYISIYLLTQMHILKFRGVNSVIKYYTTWFILGFFVIFLVVFFPVYTCSSEFFFYKPKNSFYRKCVQFYSYTAKELLANQTNIKSRVTQCMTSSWEIYHRKEYTQVCLIIIFQIENIEFC